jgi:hypothetical protein
MHKFGTFSIILLTFLGAVLATFSGFKVFDAWDQVEILWESQANPLLMIGHPHLPRYLIAYPGFLLSENIKEIGFSLYLSLFFALNAGLFREISKIVINRRPSVVSYSLLIMIQFFMNGRGVIAWSAWLLCVLCCLRVYNNKSQYLERLLGLAMSSWLASVSTGVFVLVVTTYLTFIIMKIRIYGGVKFSKMTFVLLLSIVVAWLIYEYFAIAVDKNIDFYGGGILGVLGMLEHGLGRIFFQINALNILIITAIYILTLLVSAGIFWRKLSVFDALILTPVIFGMFGFTILTLTLPLLLIRYQIMVVMTIRPKMLYKSSLSRCKL